jgi:hypothetical protein
MLQYYIFLVGLHAFLAQSGAHKHQTDTEKSDSNGKLRSDNQISSSERGKNKEYS